ncbi:MAG: polyribonucleotide nucleotidyltransferase [SAR324 cluster bacterium]|nr:polyribonucleotide nucleotidyltransferase [SAR324 cluster bacterium]
MEIVKTQFGGAEFSIETGRLAKQANGSVLVQYGDTMVLVAATADKGCGGEKDFFPLAVFYVEKQYAAGRIPGGFFKREARLSDYETLTSRVIDRPLRPSFEKNYMANTIVQATVLSHDLVNPSDVAAMIGSSAALCLSDIPFHNPIGGIRVGRVDGEFVTNPTPAQLEESELNIFMAGSKEAILMVEGEADEVSEAVMQEAIWYGHEQIQPIIAMQEELVKRVGKEKRVVPTPEVNAELQQKVDSVATSRIQDALRISDKQERYARMDALQEEVVAEVLGDTPEDGDKTEVQERFGSIKKEEMRKRILSDAVRIDGRGPKDIRPITCETRALPRAHGSAIFTRGETQALAATTLGTREDEQMIDNLFGLSYKNFMLHYNFPSFSVGEARPPRGPGRREIGHGYLAEKGLTPMLPGKESFPYTIRLVSEVLESNGSSSMATVCAGSLAMMDAGVPLPRNTAGIAMGLIFDEASGNSVILSDILGDEDHLGDMDFKVVGTEKGVTALQMDIKIQGLTKEIVTNALDQALEGRQHILKIMDESLGQPRVGLSSHAPRFITHKIPQAKIGAVIGPGGKVIKGIVEKTGVKINVDDDGVVSIASRDHKAVDVALEMVRDLTRTVEIGDVYTGPVKKVVEFGAFVEIFPGTEGLVHVSNLAQERVKNVTDVVNEGDIVTVKATGLDRRGKISLSMKDV